MKKMQTKEGTKTLGYRSIFVLACFGVTALPSYPTRKWVGISALCRWLILKLRQQHTKVPFLIIIRLCRFLIWIWLYSTHTLITQRSNRKGNEILSRAKWMLKQQLSLNWQWHFSFFQVFSDPVILISHLCPFASPLHCTETWLSLRSPSLFTLNVVCETHPSFLSYSHRLPAHLDSIGSSPLTAVSSFTLPL